MTQCDECGTVYEDEKRRCPYCGIENPDADPYGWTSDENDEDDRED